MKSTNEQSLRFHVGKWLAPGPTTSVGVVEFSRTPAGQRRYVCVESAQPAALRTLFFFRHDDVYWRVFPPAVPRMSADHLAL
nr:hypothetical protein [Cupriavidus sp. IDO]